MKITSVQLKPILPLLLVNIEENIRDQMLPRNTLKNLISNSRIKRLLPLSLKDFKVVLDKLSHQKIISRKFSVLLKVRVVFVSSMRSKVVWEELEAISGVSSFTISSLIL